MIKESAIGFFEAYGIPTIPVDAEKHPIVLEWKHWQTEPMTKEQFDALPWDKGANFAVVTGTKTKSGYYFVAIDVDKPIDYGLLPITLMQETPRGGRHFYYMSKHNCDGLKLHDIGIELLALGQIVIIRDLWLNDNLPTVVESIEGVFSGLAHALGKTELTRGRQPLTTVLQPQSQGNRNQAIFDLAAALRDKSVPFNTTLATALSTNDKYTPPLPEAEVKTAVQSAYEHPLKDPEEPVSTVTDIEEFFVKAQFEPVRFAKFLLKSYRFKTTRDNKTIYVYNPNTGTYTPTGAGIIHGEMSHYLDEKTRKHYYGDVEFYIQGVTFFDRPQTTPNKLTCLNGIVNVETHTLEPFTPDEFILTQIPIKYDPTVDCPQITKFLTEVVNSDQLCMLQQIIGYTLYQGMPLHKATMLVGDGANGKSTLIELIKLFLGGENVSNVSLQALCENRFAPAALYGKLANMFADLPDKSLARTGMFKMLSGGDTITGEEKFKQLFSFKNYAKQIYSCNKVPETHDDTIAFFRRWNIIMCPNRFMPGDPNILAKIATPQELSGLLNYALKGLHDLLEKTEFCNNTTTEQIRTQYIRQSNSAKAFIEENLEESLNCNDYIPEAELYADYIQYCTDEKLLSMKKKDFTTNLKQYMPTVKQTKERINKEVTDVYQYIKHLTEYTTVTTVPDPLLNTNNQKSILELSSASGTTGTLLPAKPGDSQ